MGLTWEVAGRATKTSDDLHLMNAKWSMWNLWMAFPAFLQIWKQHIPLTRVTSLKMKWFAFQFFALQQIYAAFPSRCGDIHNTIACFTRRWITPRTHFIPNHHTVTCSYPVNCGCIHAQKPIKYAAFALFIFEIMSKRISKCSHSVLFYESKLFGIKVELKSEFVNQNGPFQSHVSHWS